MSNPFKDWIYADPCFWIGTFDRTARTFFQALVAMFGADGAGILEAGLAEKLMTAGLTALMALLTCLATPNYVTYQESKPAPRHAKPTNPENTRIF